MTDATKEPTYSAPQTAPSIDLVDLQNAVKVIDYACEQGAFKGWQVIEQVIAVREKLANFLKAATPAAPEVTEAAPAAEVAPAPAAKKAAPKKSTTKK